jgi:hypothetical protein
MRDSGSHGGEYEDYRAIALMVEVVRTSETSAYFNETTRRYIPGGSKFHTDVPVTTPTVTAYRMVSHKVSHTLRPLVI